MNLVNFRTNCRVCKSKNLMKIVNLGLMPLAGNFVKKKDIGKKEIKVPLIIYYCKKCKLVQVKDSINPEILFKAYNYSSSPIPNLNEHFASYANQIKKKFKSKKKLKILEFGCNDGILLKEFKANENFFCLGVEPSKNISKLAKGKKLNIINDYFNIETAHKILNKYNKFDIITGSNVFAHIDDIHSVVKASKILLKDNGSLIVEVHYLLDLINLNQYDFFYHEHLNYYTINSLRHLFKIYGMEIIKIQNLKIHGGSIRVTVQKKKETNNIPKKLKKMILKEKELNIEYFKKFEEKIFRQKESIKEKLKKIKLSNKEIVGFGASGRGTTFLNFCNIEKNTINYIIDRSPLRAGKYMPGLKIPIKNMNYFYKNAKKIDYILIIAWNYKSSIIQQVKKVNNKIKFIIPFPKPKII